MSGYKSPPKHSQFKKGQSGNPFGRPRGRKNRKTILEKILAESTNYRDGDVYKKATKLELLLRAIRLKVAQGDATAMQLYDRLMGLDSDQGSQQLTGLLITRRQLNLEEWIEKYGRKR